MDDQNNCQEIAEAKRYDFNVLANKLYIAILLFFITGCLLMPDFLFDTALEGTLLGWFGIWCFFIACFLNILFLPLNIRLARTRKTLPVYFKLAFSIVLLILFGVVVVRLAVSLV